MLITLVLVSPVTYAISQDDLLHGAAHFGGTYVITNATEVICKDIRGKDHKLSCTLLGIALANAANIAYKASQGFPNDTNRAVISGALGSGFAATIISIDW